MNKFNLAKWINHKRESINYYYLNIKADYYGRKADKLIQKQRKIIANK